MNDTRTCTECDQPLDGMHTGNCGKRTMDCPDVVEDDCGAEYRWTITKDHLDGDGEHSRVGTVGPRNAHDSVTDNPSRFSLYDDDDNCYYEGMLYGDFEGFEPLDDFGTPNAGCVKMKLDGEWL